MPLTGFEYNADNRSLTRDANGKAVAQRRFNVMTRDPKEAELYIASNFGVTRGATFPGEDSLIFDANNVTAAQDGYSVDIASAYSTNGRFRMESQIDRTREGYYEFEMSVSGDGIAKVPIQYIEKRTYNQGNNSEQVWIIQWRETPYARAEYSVRVTVPAWTDVEASYVLSQANHIHVIGTKTLLFKGCNAVKTDEDGDGESLYDVAYSWSHDAGTPIIPAGAFGPSRVIYPAMARKPFEVYDALPRPDSPIDFYDVYTYCPYVTGQERGWLGLPGMPNL